MVWIDYAIIFIILFSTLISLIRGFFYEALSLITWGSAFFITHHFYLYLTVYFTYFRNEVIRNGIAIIILFITTLIIGAIINSLMSRLIIRTGLLKIDRVLGVFFGALRGILIVTIILFFIDTFTDFTQSIEWKKSQLIPQFNYIIKWFFNYLHNTSNFL
ncbi:CvpA family protein [Candidatus Fukatsuia anoeciicola]|uniref:CvpA family protein n=1 Tax=Candidatus Fukatsuia anoeciicola TaxID=2994492 RepID=UPI003463F1F7